MIRCWTVLRRVVAPLRAHHAHRIARHLRHVLHVRRAHWVSGLVCKSVAIGAAGLAVAALVHPPISGAWAPWAAPPSVSFAPPAPTLPAAAFLPGPEVWPAAFAVPLAYGGAPSGVRRARCVPGTWASTQPWCRERKRAVPEPASLALLGVGLLGLAMVRRKV